METTPHALVLGGGGVLGEAWMSALLAGLDEAEGFGFGTTYTVGADGDAELDYTTPVYRLLLSGLQAAVWLVAVLVLWRTRRRRES